MRLGHYFTLDELGGGALVADPAALVCMTYGVAHVLDPLRAALREPLHVNSGYRTPEHNARVPGAAVASLHMQGRAADVTCYASTPDEVERFALQLGLSLVELGVYRNHVHLAWGRPGDEPRVARRWRSEGP